jgi:protein ImuB
MTTRTTVVWVPDWPVAAAVAVAGVPAHLPIAVHDGRRVVATSALARAEGVRRGMRRRQAQGCCPELVLLPADDARDVRAFEPVAAAAETVVAGIEVARPGLLLLPAGGASRYHGSEEALAVALVDAVAAATGHECAVGTADGLLAAVLAARTGAVVPSGRSAAFLAGRGVGELVHAAVTDEQAAQVADLVDLLNRLGLRTLGAFAGLPGPAVHDRFGRLGAWAHTLARGLDERPPARRRPEADLVVAADLDPPVDRVDQATFAGRRLAERLHDDLVSRGVACGRLEIAARTDEGTVLARTWRTDLGGWGGLTPARMTDRIRWQLEGWLADPGAASGRERAMTLVHLSLTALDVLPAASEQGRLWGGPSGGDLRAHRALERVQGILGEPGVLVATLAGGRDVREQVHLRPWGDQTDPPRPVDRPWPGRLPDPAPATVLDPPCAVEVRDEAGEAVRLDRRAGLTGVPALVVWPAGDGTAAGGPAVLPGGGRTADGLRGDRPAGERPSGGTVSSVAGWAGPWLVADRWWSQGSPGAGVRAHLQVVLDDGRAVLLVGTPDGWTCEAAYD